MGEILSLENNKELKELIENFRRYNRIRLLIIGTFGVFAIIIWLLNIWPYYTELISTTILLFLVLITLCEGLIPLSKIGKIRLTVTRASTWYTIFQILEIMLLLAIVHFAGALPYGAMLVFVPYVVFCYLSFTRRIYPRLVILIITVGFVTLGSLEYFGVLTPRDTLNLGVILIQTPTVFIADVIFTTGLLIWSVIYTDFFSGRLRNYINSLRISTKELTKKEKELREERASLTIKVKARTKELEELTQSLDKKVQERTKQLQTRINQLERFTKLTVGREIRMSELKKEIEKKEEEIKRLKKEL